MKKYHKWKVEGRGLPFLTLFHSVYRHCLLGLSLCSILSTPLSAEDSAFLSPNAFSSFTRSLLAWRRLRSSSSVKCDSSSCCGSLNLLLALNFLFLNKFVA